MADPVKNFIYSTVATAPSPATSGTSLILNDASIFPDPSTDGAYNIVVWPDGVSPSITNAEIVRVTAKSSNTLTITRTQESTAARTIVEGDQVALSVTAKTITDLQSATPVGTVVMNAATSAPSGWLECNGQAVSRTTYASLYTALGTTYGSGDGSTTFNLPDIAGRVPVGYDSGDGDFDALGETGGSKTHTLSTGEMPTHSHGVSQSAHNHGQYVTANSGGPAHRKDWDGDGTCYAYSQGTNTGTSNANISINNAGSGGAHNNVQPYITLKFYIKY